MPFSEVWFGLFKLPFTPQTRVASSSAGFVGGCSVERTFPTLHSTGFPSMQVIPIWLDPSSTARAAADQQEPWLWVCSHMKLSPICNL